MILFVRYYMIYFIFMIILIIRNEAHLSSSCYLLSYMAIVAVTSALRNNTPLLTLNYPTISWHHEPLLLAK